MLSRQTFDEWNRMIDVNLKGVLYGVLVIPRKPSARSVE